MWWFYGWSGFWNMINSACSCATFQDKRSWATHYPPQLNPTSLPFSSKKNPPDLAKKLPAKLPTSSLSQKKDTAAAAGNGKMSRRFWRLVVPDPQLGSSKQSPCDRAERSYLAKCATANLICWLERIYWQPIIPTKKTHKTQIRSLSLKGGKATKFKSGSFCAKQSRTNSERDRYTVKPELLIRERATCM